MWNLGRKDLLATVRPMYMRRCVRLRRYRGGSESLHDAAILSVAYSSALAAQTHQILVERSEFRDALLNVSYVRVEKQVHFSARLPRRV